MNNLFSLNEMKIGIDDSLKVSIRDIEENYNPFQEIGIGKPLVLRLECCYIGDLKNSLFKKRHDVIISSTIKDDVTSNVPTMAIHQIASNKKDNDFIEPSSRSEGTELIYYTDALDSSKLKINIQLKSEKFDKTLTDNISSALYQASSIPIFAATAPYLIVGGKITKIAGSIANKLSARTALLNFDFDIESGLEGKYDDESGFVFGCNIRDRGIFEGYKITRRSYDKNKLYLAKNGSEYKGPAPYVILSVGGKKHSEYSGFKAQSATTSMLNKFYGSEDAGIEDNIVELLQVANDYTYVKKIKALKKERKNASNERTVTIDSLIDAYVKNIKDTDTFNVKIE